MFFRRKNRQLHIKYEVNGKNLQELILGIVYIIHKFFVYLHP